jgi:hypothetical protein
MTCVLDIKIIIALSLSLIIFMNVYLQLQEFKAFADLRQRLEPLSMAIFAYGKVNGLLTKEDLKRATQHVSFFYQT